MTRIAGFFGLGHASMQRDAAAIRGEFQRIGQQVIDNLFQLSLIRHDKLGNTIHIRGKLDTVFHRFFLDHYEAVFKQEANRRFGYFQFQFACFDFGKIKDIINQGEQMAAALQYVTEIFFLDVIDIPEIFIDYKFRKADNVV